MKGVYLYDVSFTSYVGRNLRWSALILNAIFLPLYNRLIPCVIVNLLYYMILLIPGNVSHCSLKYFRIFITDNTSISSNIKYNIILDNNITIPLISTRVGLVLYRLNICCAETFIEFHVVKWFNCAMLFLEFWNIMFNVLWNIIVLKIFYLLTLWGIFYMSFGIELL